MRDTQEKRSVDVMKITKQQPKIGPPQKCHIYSADRMVFPCWGQFKLGGLRARYVNRHFYSGDKSKDLQWHDPVVSHLLEPLSHLNIKYKLDGEFYRHGWKVQQINSAIGVKNLLPKKETLEVFFYVFDTLNPRQSFQEDRRVEASECVKLADYYGKGIKFVPSRVINNQKEADDFYKGALKLGFEGVVYRMSHSKNGKYVDEGYRPGYQHWMLKRKEEKDAEFRVVGMTEGRMTEKGGKHVGRMGALTCETKKGKRFNVGGGYSDAERDEHWKNPPIGKFLRVTFRELSLEGVPQEPRALNIRDYELD